jgi:hypothetical protein
MLSLRSTPLQYTFRGDATGRRRHVGVTPRKGPGSNLYPETGYTDCGFHGLPQSLRVNSARIPYIGVRPFLCTPQLNIH